MIIRCKFCCKVWNDKKDDEKIFEGTCKQCVFRGHPQTELVQLCNLVEMLKDPVFAKEWEESGAGIFFALD